MDQIRAMFQLRTLCRLACYVERVSNGQNSNIKLLLYEYETLCPVEGRLQCEGAGGQGAEENT